VSAEAKEEAAVAVEQLRQFVALYDGVVVEPDSHIAHQLEAAQQAVSAYERVESKLAQEA
jgi:hypothetical protein